MKRRAKQSDAVWRALSDPTRREILDLLRDGPKTTTQIADRFSQLTRFAIMKHLDVLRDAKLVMTRAEGRQRINSLNAAPLRDIIERWIGKYEAYWSNTLLRVRDDAEAEARGKKGRRGRQA